jgi:hypothetical protein
MFTPLAGRHRMLLTVVRVDGEWAQTKRLDGRAVRCSVDRLLEVDGLGAGLHYRFQGWHPLRRGYRTQLEVLGIAGDRFQVRLSEWQPDLVVDLPAAELPTAMRMPGAKGSCMADLSSSSAAGLNIHSCRRGKLVDGSRQALPRHPDVVAKGQRFRRRRDGVVVRILDGTTGSVRAWNGYRVVRLARGRLLAATPGGDGLHFEYLGGGEASARSQRQREL